ncbi:MAG: RNA polymerase sigma factor FliA [Polaromonas sp.]|jgi:RNA polymerase sigma factor for flagellar operon FliA
MYNPKGQLSRDALLKQYTPLVRRMAHHMIAKVPASVEVDDLIQVGMIGLADALARYEIGHGTQFETFATQRIRGSMIDELRETDWLSRASRKGQKDIEKAIHKLEQRFGRGPQEQEIADEMNVSLSDYQDMLTKARGTQLIYLEDLSGRDDDDDVLDRYVGDEDANPLNILQNRKMREALVAAIKVLPEREQFIMGMYYEQDMNLKEIAEVLKITEARVSQLHSQAVTRLRSRLRTY